MTFLNAMLINFMITFDLWKWFEHKYRSLQEYMTLMEFEAGPVFSTGWKWQENSYRARPVNTILKRVSEKPVLTSGFKESAIPRPEQQKCSVTVVYSVDISLTWARAQSRWNINFRHWSNTVRCAHASWISSLGLFSRFPSWRFVLNYSFR